MCVAFVSCVGDTVEWNILYVYRKSFSFHCSFRSAKTGFDYMVSYVKNHFTHFIKELKVNFQFWRRSIIQERIEEIRMLLNLLFLINLILHMKVTELNYLEVRVTCLYDKYQQLAATFCTTVRLGRYFMPTIHPPSAIYDINYNFCVMCLGLMWRPKDSI